MGWILKRLVKILIILIIILTVFGVVPLILLSKETTPPISQYAVVSERDFYHSLDEELTSLISDENEEIVFLTIDEPFINQVIQKKLSQDNSKYLNDQFSEDIEYNYMLLFGKHIGFKGIWTTIQDDKITVTAGADYVTGNGSVLYQTGLEIVFDIVLSEDNQYYLKVNSIDLGKLNLANATAYKLSNFIINTLTKNSINDLIAENLNFGTFDAEALSFTVGEDELTDYLYDMDPTFSALLKIIYKENLLILDVSDDGFDISLNIGDFRRLLSDSDEPDFDRWDNEADKAVFMANLAANALVNFGLNPINPKIDLTESDVNSILDYTLTDDVQFDFPFTFTVDSETIEYIFSSTNLFVQMDGDILSIHLKMTLTKTGLEDTFDMQFNLSSHVSMNANGDMLLSIIDSNIGDIELDNDMLESLFSIFDETLFQDDSIVIAKEKLNEMFEGSNIVITDAYVSGGELKLHYGLDN